LAKKIFSQTAGFFPLKLACKQHCPTTFSFWFCLTGLFLQMLLVVRLDPPKCSTGESLGSVLAEFLQARCPSYHRANSVAAL